MNWVAVTAVAMGGALGSVLRFLVARWLTAIVPQYPAVGTLTVNVVGSFAIGFLLAHGVTHRWMTETARQFLVVGFLGGLTTFSSLASETSTLARGPSPFWSAGGHLLANVTLGLIAVRLGEVLGRSVTSP